jgi:hypothetical protein
MMISNHHSREKKYSHSRNNKQDEENVCCVEIRENNRKYVDEKHADRTF